MHSRIRVIGVIALSLTIVLGIQVSSAYSQERKYPASIEKLEPITFMQSGEKRTVGLADAFDFHGGCGACPGATMTFMAVGYGLNLLYGDETPDLDDLVITTRAPGGPMDVIDLLMKGGDKSKRTWPPAGITMSADNFVFRFYRKSTMEGVTVRLKQGLWPEDWFELRKKSKNGTISAAEQEKRQKDRERIVREFPGKSFQELFGEPEVYKLMVWGHIQPGEMDRLNRELRRKQRSKGE